MALHERGVEQRALIRPGRSWRKDLENSATIYEGFFGAFAFPLPPEMADEPGPSRVRAGRHNGLAVAGEPLHAGPCQGISHLPAGDYPEHLGYYTNARQLVCITPDMAAKVRELGWKRDMR